MKLELIFRGELAPGLSREQAAERLSTVVKQPADVVFRRLFTGQPVKIKTVQTEDDADRFVNAFAKAGVMLEVQPQTSADTAGKAAAAATKGRRSAGVYWAAAAGVLIAVMIAGAWYTQPAWRQQALSERAVAAARALGTDDLVALGRLDVRRAIELEKRIVGGADPEALLSPDDDDTWQSLARAGIDVGEQVEDVIVAFHADAGRSDWSIVAIGSFDADVVHRWISSRYQVERFDPATATTYFTWLDRTSCEPVESKALRVGATELTFTSADRIDELAARLSLPNARLSPAVAEWLALADTELMTIGIFAPASLGQAADGMAGMILAAAGHAASPATALYFGASPTLLPPGVQLSGTIASDDTAFLDQAHSAASSWLSAATEAARSSSPDLVAIYDRLSVARAGDTFRAGVRLDTDLDNEVQRLIAALFQNAFRVSGLGELSMPAEEQLEESPTQFGDASRGDLRPYASFGDGFFEPQWQQGPFALAVSRLAVDDSGGLLVSLKGEGRGLPNLGDRSKLVRMNIIDVVDTDDATLLPAQECGPTRNKGWTDDSQVSRSTRFEGTEIVYYPTVSIDRQLKLAAGSDARDVAAIRGELEFLLPTRVQSVRLDAPFDGRVVEGRGVRLRFRSGSDSAISYEVSGDRRRLLSVRALNANGQVLASGASSWSGGFLGGAENVSADFYGAVAGAEVLLAGELEPIRFPFELSGAFPSVAARAPMGHAPPAMATPEGLSQALAASPPEVTFDFGQPISLTTAGPSTLALERLQVNPFMGLYAEMELFVPLDLPLNGQLNGAAVILDRIVLPDDRSIDLGLAAPASLAADGGFWLNGEYRSDEARPWLKARVGIQAPEYDADLPTSLHGRVVFRAAEDTATAELPTAPGSRLSEHGIDVIVSEWRENTLYLSVRDGADRIVSVVALDADGRPAGRADELAGTAGDARVGIDLTVHPETLRIVAATETREFETPFSMRLEQ